MDFVRLMPIVRNLFRVKKHGVDIRIACSANVRYQVVANHDRLVIFYAITVQRKIEDLTGWFSVPCPFRCDDMVEIRRQITCL